jgi:hypothetical protein
MKTATYGLRVSVVAAVGAAADMGDWRCPSWNQSGHVTGQARVLAEILVTVGPFLQRGDVIIVLPS